MSPKVSVVIVNYNGKDYLDRCLKSIFKNSYRHYEVIVVDNGSTDGSLALIKDNFVKGSRKVRLVSLVKNFGPARARNEGVKKSTGQYLAFLDNDTQVDKNWIKEALKFFKRDQQIGCLQCKLLLLNEKNKFDYAGEYLGSSGFLVQRVKYGEIDRGQYDQLVEILAAKSAGMFIRRDVFNKAGSFDEDYFIYMEETDLGWRVWLKGFKTIFCSRSIVYHEFSSSLKVLGFEKAKYNIRFHGTKNYLSTLIKNLELKNLLIILPKHLLIWFFLAVILAVVKGQFREFVWIFKGIFWNFKNIRKTLVKRTRIQNDRFISDRELFKLIYRKQNLLIKVKQFVFAEKLLKEKREDAQNFNKNSSNIIDPNRV